MDLVLLPKSTSDHSTRSQLPYLIGLILISILVGLPLLQGKFIGGHDSILYPPRFIEFVQGLRSLQWFPRWAPDLSSGYGQPFFIYNPPLLYYVVGLINISGVGLFNSINTALLMVIFSSALGMYLLASEFIGPKAGLAAATAYIFAPYFLVNLYARAAWSDFIAFSCIPFLFWSIYRFANEGQYRFFMISTISMTLLMLSSNHISLITVPFVLILISWNAYIQRNWKVLWRGFIPLAFGLGLSAFFWLPAIIDMRYVHLEREIGSNFDYHDHFIFPRQLFSSYWGYGGSVAGPDDKMSFSIGPVHVILVIILIPFLWKIWKSSKSIGWWFIFMLLVITVSIFFATSISEPIWERLPLIKSLQFPWRFLTLVVFSSSFIASFPFILISHGNRLLSNLVLFTIIATIIMLGLPNARPPMYHDLTESDWRSGTIINHNLKVNHIDMFEPIWVRKKPNVPAISLFTMLKGQGVITATRLSPTHLQANIELQLPSSLRANVNYYPGWELYVNGDKHKFSFDNAYGNIEFNLEPGRHHIDLVFTNTPLRLWSEWFSLFFLILIIIMSVSVGMFKGQPFSSAMYRN
ncbi:MAG: hypothetical protein B6D39_08435 [Anaerolineae bacterium UTCFX2]|nr:hypothetical protein [Anaerolineae bacterium]OQY90317.1 MAG: hypothetical protein B6D39_08435 [Anaerolineae bacterium UTCFX2]